MMGSQYDHWFRDCKLVTNVPISQTLTNYGRLSDPLLFEVIMIRIVLIVMMKHSSTFSIYLVNISFHSYILDGVLG